MTDLLIDGRLAAGGSGTFDTINPATEEPIGLAADGDAADLQRQRQRPHARARVALGTQPHRPIGQLHRARPGLQYPPDQASLARMHRLE